MGAPPFDFGGVRTYPFAERQSLVHLRDMARPPEDPAVVLPFLSCLPDILAARDIKRLAQTVVGARVAKRGVILALGAHVVKTGAGLHLLPLIREGLVTHLAVNGAFAIHDYELGRFGATSEDVGRNLPRGLFGLVEETGEALNRLVKAAAATGEPFGHLVGREITACGQHADASVLACAAEEGVGVTIHVTMGADIVHQHPTADGAAWGTAGLHDFRRLAEALSSLHGGGVFVNVGSAVNLPEVFVKALNIARHLGATVEGFTTANMDMIQHYRPRQNVLSRPTVGHGDCLALTGHHEIMIPLWSAATRAYARQAKATP